MYNICHIINLFVNMDKQVFRAFIKHIYIDGKDIREVETLKRKLIKIRMSERKINDYY